MSETRIELDTMPDERTSPRMRELFINAIQHDLATLYEAIETGRRYGVKCSVLIPVNGKPSLQVEE